MTLLRASLREGWFGEEVEEEARKPRGLFGTRGDERDKLHRLGRKPE